MIDTQVAKAFLQLHVILANLSSGWVANRILLDDDAHCRLLTLKPFNNPPGWGSGPQGCRTCSNLHTSWRRLLFMVASWMFHRTGVNISRLIQPHSINPHILFIKIVSFFLWFVSYVKLWLLFCNFFQPPLTIGREVARFLLSKWFLSILLYPIHKTTYKMLCVRDHINHVLP